MVALETVAVWVRLVVTAGLEVLRAATDYVALPDVTFFSIATVLFALV